MINLNNSLRMDMKTLLFQLILFLLVISCTNKPAPPAINPKAFDKMVDGKQVKLFTLKNSKGM
jgi:hypothetical protein